MKGTGEWLLKKRHKYIMPAMKKLLNLLGVIILALFALFFIKDTLVRIIVEKSVETATGLEVSLGDINIDFAKSTILIKNSRLFNPKEYQDRDLLDLSEIHIIYDRSSILKRRINLKEVRIGLKKLSVVKDKNGRNNLNSLKTVRKRKDKDNKQPSKNAGLTDAHLHIERFELNIAKVVYKEYSKNNPPLVREFNINRTEKHKNITNLSSLVNTLIVKTLAYTTIANMANLDLSRFQSTIGQAVEKTKESTRQIIQKTQAGIQTNR